MRLFHTLSAQRTLRAFNDSSFRALWTANLLIYSSRWIQVTVLGWFVLDKTDSPLLIALVGFFGWAPVFALSLFGGVLADAFNRKVIIISTQVLAFITALSMVVLIMTGQDEFWHAYPVIMVTGLVWSLDMPSRRSAIYDLLGMSGVTNGVALDSGGMSASRVIGPALGGFLTVLVGFSGAYIVVCVFYFFAIILVGRVNILSREFDNNFQLTILDDLKTGLVYVATNRVILGVVLTTMVMNLFMFPFVYLVPIIARDVLGVGVSLMGMLQSFTGIGSLLGAVIVASIVDIKYHGRIFLLGSIVSIIALVLFSFSDWYLVSLLFLLILGFGHSGFSTMQSTTVMLMSRSDIRGKALGVVNLAIGSQPFGALLIGALAERFGPASAITIQGSVAGICIIVIMVSLQSLWGPFPADRSRERFTIV